MIEIKPYKTAMLSKIRIVFEYILYWYFTSLF